MSDKSIKELVEELKERLKGLPPPILPVVQHQPLRNHYHPHRLGIDNNIVIIDYVNLLGPR